MAVNASSNASLLNFTSSSKFYCFIIAKPSSQIFALCNVMKILLLLPLCLLVIYLGLQRWRQQRSTSAAEMTSHSDSFTYHMVAMELIGILGYILNCWAVCLKNVNVFYVGYCLSFFIWYGETFLHILTCVERYLAVVHPVTYLSLKGERGTRIRNISIGCVWLLSVGTTAVNCLENFMDYSLIFFSFIIISFCSFSVLCVLIRPGPGEQSGDRRRVDQSKRRAFYTILAILGALVMRFTVSLFLYTLHVVTDHIECVVLVSEVWFNLPSSLGLPLLFLQRAGILRGSKKNAK